MNKAELVDAIAASANLSKADAKRALDGFIAASTDALTKNEKISLVGFGTFSLSRREEREGRNPRWKAGDPGDGKVKIAAKNVVRFKAGADLNGKVN